MGNKGKGINGALLGYRVDLHHVRQASDSVRGRRSGRSTRGATAVDVADGAQVYAMFALSGDAFLIVPTTAF